MKSFDEIMVNESFWDKMKGCDRSGTEFKESFIAENPDLSEEFHKAFRLHNALLFRKNTVSIKEKYRAKGILLRRISAYEKTKKPLYTSLVGFWVGIAASILILVSITIPATLYLTDRLQHKVAYNEIVVPSGEKSSITLTDGTTVWLNSESRLRFPSKIRKNSREVYLEGEGYFDVAPMDRSNFTVITQNIRIVALGTIFNVKSYASESTIETTLIEGSVKLQQTEGVKTFDEIVLKPNQKMVYRKPTGTTNVNYLSNESNEQVGSTSAPKQEPSPVIIQRVNISNVVCWKDHLLVFENETLEEIAVKMSRWYNIRVEIIDKELYKHRYTGRFINNETYNQVLEAINLTTPIMYTADNNVLIIKQLE